MTNKDPGKSFAYVGAAGVRRASAMPPDQHFALQPWKNALATLEKSAQKLEQLKAGADANKLAAINAKIYSAEQSLLLPAGLPRRPWYKHSLYAPGFYTGYGVKTVPGVREAIEQQNWTETQQQITAVANAINKFSSYLDAL